MSAKPHYTVYGGVHRSGRLRTAARQFQPHQAKDPSVRVAVAQPRSFIGENRGHNHNI